MIYATMCIGEKWCNKFSKSINDFSENFDIRVLTDNIDLFPKCKTYYYERNVFSYYEKLNHIFNLIEETEERITYIDADFISSFNTNIQFDLTTLYCGNILNIKELPLKKYITNNTVEDIKNIFKSIDVNEVYDYYIHEAIISFPYTKYNHEIKKDIEKLQSPIESLYNKNSATTTHKRYSGNGVGYGEGWALQAILTKYKIDKNSLNEFPNKTWRKLQLI